MPLNLTKESFVPIIDLYYYLFVIFTTMGGKEKIGDTQDKTERGKGFPKVDIEVKNVKVAKEIQKQFEGFVAKTPEWKEIENMKTDAKKLNAEMQKSFNEQFERQVDSGEIVQVLYKIEKDILVN